MVLGASLHDILTRLKAEPRKFSQIELLYSRDEPFGEPVSVELPANGLRLRFDGAEQRLRLVEVIDFTRNHITFKDRDVLRPVNSGPVPGEMPASGPTFRHIYHKLLGPTYDGEYMPPTDKSATTGVYVLSYPGVAFTFSLPHSAYSPTKDVVTLLSAAGATNQIALSMAVFSGDSWADARDTLWTEVLPPIKASPTLAKGKETCPDEVSLVRIYGGGRLQLFRRWTIAPASALTITLGETTPQQLVAELGPPNAIYNKQDQRLVIHKVRSASGVRSSRPGTTELRQRRRRRRSGDLTDTDQSSVPTGSESDDSDDDENVESRRGDDDDDDDDDGNEVMDGNEQDGDIGSEYFYNYFHLGFDVLISSPVTPSPAPPSSESRDLNNENSNPASSPPPQSSFIASAPGREVATKLILHGNVPGSYEFNRHRRCRWEIAYLAGPNAGSSACTSETVFTEIEDQLSRTWFANTPTSPTSPNGKQRGMVLNRGWGDSPSSSCELLGGWEESAEDQRARVGRAKGAGGEDDTTTLYGFPGLVFEVLRNGFVNTLTVF